MRDRTLFFLKLPLSVLLMFLMLAPTRAETVMDSVRSRTDAMNEMIESDVASTGVPTRSIVIPDEQLSIPVSQPITAAQATNTEELVTLNFKNGDLQNILRMIARSARVNIIAGPDVTGSVTIELHKVHWEQALALVLGVNGYTYIRDGNIIRVISTDRVEKEPLSVSIVTVNYAKAAELIPVLRPLLTPERGKIECDQRSNVLIINDIPTKISQIEKVVERLDTPTPQVLIEVKFVEIGVGEIDTQGVDWSNLGDYGVVFQEMLYTFDREITRSTTRDRASGTDAQMAQATRGYAKNDTEAITYQFAPEQFRIALSMLLNNARAKIISNPRIQTLDNRKATIRVAETRYKPKFTYNKETGAYEINELEDIYIGITLEVTPHINQNGYITLDITPEVSALSGVQVIQGVEVPIPSIRMIDARVSLKDTYTVAIGGLIKDDWTFKRRSVPFLGDLPYIGSELFSWRQKEKKQNSLIIFITATIAKPEEPTDRWDRQLRDMHLTPDGEWKDVITNYPSWRVIARREQEILAAVSNSSYSAKSATSPLDQGE